jgi:CheY-like chemotaxis protein
LAALMSEGMSSSESTNRTILLVDDELGLLDVAAEYLQHTGYTVFSAGNAAIAMQFFQDVPCIDVLVTDVHMPGGMTGVELAAIIRSRCPATRVVFTSGLSANALAQKNFSLEDGAFLRKPYRLAELDAAIRFATRSIP